MKPVQEQDWLKQMNPRVRPGVTSSSPDLEEWGHLIGWHDQRAQASWKSLLFPLRLLEGA
jgi:hypothetical protein